MEHFASKKALQISFARAPATHARTLPRIWVLPWKMHSLRCVGGPWDCVHKTGEILDTHTFNILGEMSSLYICHINDFGAAGSCC